jgi:short-subunit dehydrogenase
MSCNKGPYALVAGGSKGIGYAISEALAKRGFNLILVARHYDSLLAAKNRLENMYRVAVEILPLDLASEETAPEIAWWCTSRNIPLKVLCNVAGLGGVNDYLSQPLDSIRYMINLNLGSEAALCMLLLPLLEANAPSYILNVASMAGFAPIPVKNMYSATKVATIYFSYSLKYQLMGKNISVSCLCPGPVFTKPSIVQDTKEKLGWWGMKMAVPKERVGEVAVKKMLRRKMIIIPGILPKINAFGLRILPRGIAVKLIYKQAAKERRHAP